MKTSLLLPVLLVSALSSLAAGEAPLVVHEWGTFTSLQNESGEAIGGINTDDEPVPRFVRRLAFQFLLSRTEAPPVFFQGTPHCHPDVTMRLETPVLYFHPPAGWTPRSFDVKVEFHGGWLTEFFPAAEAKAPGFDAANPELPFALKPEENEHRFANGFGHLRPETQSELLWRNVTLGAGGAGPETQEKVWLAPRAVEAAMLQTASGEREKFLFYRGVGNAKADLRVVRQAAAKTLEIQEEPSLRKPADETPDRRIPAAWLVQAKPDGTCAFRSLGALDPRNRPRATVPESFAAEDFSATRLALLQQEMRTALEKAGLFADEAEALLRTWEISYFKSPGLRFFYVCTADEIARRLPLTISVPSALTRVMIGRIEIVTPEQRALLAEIAAGPAPEPWKMRGITSDSQSAFFQNQENVRRWIAVMEGSAPYRDLGLPIPKIYAAYLQLGRFRNALLLDEAKRHPTGALSEFIEKNEFEAYEIR